MQLQLIVLAVLVVLLVVVVLLQKVMQRVSIQKAQKKDVPMKKKRKNGSPVRPEGYDNSVEKVQLRKQRVVTGHGLEEEKVDDTDAVLATNNSAIEFIGDSNQAAEVEEVYDDFYAEGFDLRTDAATFDDENTESLVDFTSGSSDAEGIFPMDIDEEGNANSNSGTCEEVECTVVEESLIEKLRSMREHVKYFSGPEDTENVQVHYCSKDVQQVTLTDGRIELRPYRVYVNGCYKPWDARAEVRIPPHERAEIEFGLSMTIPEGYEAIIMPVDKMEEKYSLRFIAKEFVVSRANLHMPLYLRVTALETGYVSNTGVLFNMVLQKRVRECDG